MKKTEKWLRKLMHNFVVHSNESACRKSRFLGLDQVFIRRVNLLSNLKPLVTTHPSESMVTPTGIPTHFSVVGKVVNPLTLLKGDHNERQQLPSILCKYV